MVAVMLTLLLLRHGKATLGHAGLSDHERTLTKRGVKAAGRMGRFIAEQGLTPQMIACSDAVRTRSTVELALGELGGNSIDVSYHTDMYLASEARLLDRVRKWQPEYKSVMMVGHNPGLHALALELVGCGDHSGVRAMGTGFPTAGLAVLLFETDTWAEIKPRLGALTSFVVPRDLD